MDLALDATCLGIRAYRDDPQGVAEFQDDVGYAREAVLSLRELVPEYAQTHLDEALGDIDCALTGHGTIDDRMHDVIEANAAVRRASKLMLNKNLAYRKVSMIGYEDVVSI